MRIISFRQAFFQFAFHLNYDSIKFLDLEIFLISQKLQVCLLILARSQLSFHDILSLFRLLFRSDNLQVQLIVFSDNAFIFFLKRVKVGRVTLGLSFELVIQLFQLLESLRCLKQVIQKLLCKS